MAITYDPRDQFWKKVNRPGVLESIKKLEQSLPNGVEARWTAGQKGIQIIWNRGRKHNSPKFCGVSAKGPEATDKVSIYTDTSVKELFGDTKEGKIRALPLIEAYVKDLAEHSGCEAEDVYERLRKSRGRTWSLRNGGSPLYFADFDLEKFRFWPDCMQRFMSNVVHSEEAERINRINAYEQENYWETIERECAALATFMPSAKLVSDMARDIPASAYEGMPVDQLQKIRHRASHLAKLFKERREKAGEMHCDDCGLDPVKHLEGKSILPRAVMDAHHRNPLAEGKRLTSTEDFDLMCPTCHRVRHILLRQPAKAA